MLTKAVPFVRPMITYSVLSTGSTQPQMSLASPPPNSSSAMKATRSMFSQGNSPAIPFSQGVWPCAMVEASRSRGRRRRWIMQRKYRFTLPDVH